MIVAIVMFLSLLTMPNVVLTFAESTGSEVIDEKQLLVKYSDDYHAFSDKKVLQDVDSVEAIAAHVDLLTFPQDADMDAIKTDLENDPTVEFVEPNYQRQLFYAVNDPYYSNQWWAPHVKVENIWLHDRFQQRKVVVAVIDSGIDMNHEDLKARIEPGGYNFYANNTAIMDLDGHGTKVSGVIAAESGNGRGISGIAGPYNVSILPLKVSNLGSASGSDIIKAIDYAIMKNVSVINISLGGPTYSALENEAIQRANRAGIVVVAAAGNDALKGNPVFYPASYEQVISVGAVDKSNSRAVFSNYNAFIDLVAPGQAIYTTFPYHSYGQVNGTSFSAPIVAGTVAMMQALKPKMSTGEIIDLLKSTAKDLGVPGRDDHYGAGVLDVENLMTQLMVQEIDQEFKGDFPEMMVSDSKVFTVTFNQELDLGKDYSKVILISQKANGSQPVTSFTAKVDPASLKKLLITPSIKWAVGEHYLTVTAKVQSKGNKALKDDVRMKFFVENSFEVIDTKSDERVEYKNI